MRISDWSSDVCSSDLERKDKGYLYSERRYGSFHRQVSLPSDVDQNGITAQFKDGILTVTLAKDENVPARSRKIEIGKRSEEHTSELQSLMRISYAVFCLKKKNTNHTHKHNPTHNTTQLNT